MKNSKKGISLIVLVITIIVIIILAAAVLLSLNANNPISNARQATFDSDVDNVRSAINLYIGNFMANNPTHDAPFNPSTAKDWIYVGEGGSIEAKYAETADSNTTYGDKVTWEKLGLSKPASIKSIAYNCETCAVCAIPAQANVKFTYRPTAGADAQEVDNSKTSAESAIGATNFYNHS